MVQNNPCRIFVHWPSSRIRLNGATFTPPAHPVRGWIHKNGLGQNRTDWHFCCSTSTAPWSFSTGTNLRACHFYDRSSQATVNRIDGTFSLAIGQTSCGPLDHDHANYRLSPSVVEQSDDPFVHSQVAFSLQLRVSVETRTSNRFE